MVFILQFVIVVYHIDLFVDIKKYLQPWNKSHLIMVYDSFNTLLSHFASISILLRIFPLTFISDICL